MHFQPIIFTKEEMICVKFMPTSPNFTKHTSLITFLPSDF
nr:MAG TPA: hypothetical protein [Caudoviricetes sp.]